MGFRTELHEASERSLFTHGWWWQSSVYHTHTIAGIDRSLPPCVTPAFDLPPCSEEWFDNNGQNFAVVIAPVGVGPGTLLESRADDGGGARGVDVAADVGGLPALPQELCGIWAYIKWEQAGCPNRSQEDADKEYQAGIKEMNALLRTGRSLDFLWRVARGEVKYRDVADGEGR